MNWAIDQIIDKFVDEAARNLDVQYLEGDTVTAAEIMGAARSFSMFSDKRVVVIKNYLPVIRRATDVDSEELIDLCNMHFDQAILIFAIESKYEKDITAYGKKLMNVCNSYEFARLDRAALQSFISKRVRNAGRIIGSKEMNYLIDVSGYYNRESDYTLSQLNSDLEKICNAGDVDRISNDLIDDLLIGKEDKYVFNLIDALMSGNKSKAMEIAETIIHEDDGAMAVLALLTKQLEIMYDALELEKEGLSIGQMSKATGVNEFRFKRAYQAARRFDIGKLRGILKNAYNADRDIKTGELDKDLAFELLIISI